MREGNTLDDHTAAIWGAAAIEGAAGMKQLGPRSAEVWTFVAAGLILIFVTFFGQHLVSGPGSQGDELAYLRYATNLTHGQYAIPSQASHGLYLWHGPGLPLVLAPLVALHASVRAMRLVGPLSLLLAGIFFWLFLRRWVSRWLALAGGVILALFPPYLRLLPHLFSEPLALMFLMAALWALGNAHESGRLRWTVASGVLFGFMVLTRVEDGWILLAGLAALAVIALWKRRRANLLNLICVAVAVVVCLPWLAYTDSLAHKFPYWASSGGMSLYWMASTTPGNTGSWVDAEQVATSRHWLPDRPLFQRVNSMPQVQADAELQRVSLRLIRRHPGVYLEHVADNLSRMVLGGPYSFQPAGRGIYLYGVDDVLLLIALAIAIVVLARRGPPRVPEAVRLLVIFGVLNLLIHLVVAAYPRMTTLSIPAALAVIALGAERIYDTRRRGSAPSSAALAN